MRVYSTCSNVRSSLPAVSAGKVIHVREALPELSAKLSRSDTLAKKKSRKAKKGPPRKLTLEEADARKRERHRKVMKRRSERLKAGQGMYGPNCRHCKKPNPTKPRGLCAKCSGNPEIRNSYPSKSKYASAEERGEKKK